MTLSSCRNITLCFTLPALSTFNKALNKARTSEQRIKIFSKKFSKSRIEGKCFELDSTATQFRQGGVSTPDQTLIKQPILSPELRGEKGQCGCSAGSESQENYRVRHAVLGRLPKKRSTCEGRALTQ